MSQKIAYVLCAFILSMGILGAGYSVGKGIYLVKKMSRTVTVKGLAEQDVVSDLGIWEMNYREVGDDLIHLDQRLQQDQAAVVAFLKQHGFTEQDMEKTQLRVEDRLANIYAQNTNQNTQEHRYVLTGGIRVRSTKVHLIEQVLPLVEKLLQQGIPLAFDVSGISPNPSFYFTQLDRIRPMMLAHATTSARILAKQFAKDSHSRIGKIQHASQGVFQMMARDTSTLNADWNSSQSALGSVNKKVRLVTTIDYLLA